MLEKQRQIKNAGLPAKKTHLLSSRLNTPEKLSRGQKIAKLWEFTFANDKFDHYSQELTFAMRQMKFFLFNELKDKF